MRVLLKGVKIREAPVMTENVVTIRGRGTPNVGNLFLDNISTPLTPCREALCAWALPTAVTSGCWWTAPCTGPVGRSVAQCLPTGTAGCWTVARSSGRAAAWATPAPLLPVYRPASAC